MEGVIKRGCWILFLLVELGLVMGDGLERVDQVGGGLVCVGWDLGLDY